MENYNEKEVKMVEYSVVICLILFVILGGLYLKNTEKEKAQAAQTQVTQKVTPTSTVTQTISERTQQSAYEDRMKNNAKETGLNPVSALAAYKSARNYVTNVGGFSQKTLYRQLTFEDFTEDESIFAISWLETLKQVDYNKQAYLSAKRYMDLFSMSQERLYNQLEFEGYTDEQITYAVAKIFSE